MTPNKLLRKDKKIEGLKKCPICGSKKLKVLKKCVGWYHTKGEFAIQCTECKTIRHGVPIPKWLFN